MQDVSSFFAQGGSAANELNAFYNQMPLCQDTWVNYLFDMNVSKYDENRSPEETFVTILKDIYKMLKQRSEA